MITFDNVTFDGCTTEFFRLLERSKQGGQPEPLPARLVPAGLLSSHWWWRHR